MSMNLTKGQILENRYRIVSLIGQGGMANVYKVEDLRLSRPCALKEMLPDPNASTHTLRQARDQFRREAEILAKLSHPNLPAVYDHFTWAGKEYLVMEFIEGESLDELLDRYPNGMPSDEVWPWMTKLTEALQYCHEHGIVHRDIKPANILLKPDGGVVLVDFGLVKLFDPTNPKTLTIVRGMGTPEYAPLEQFDAKRHTDARSDIYSLGATLYHALTGQPPLEVHARLLDPTAFRTPRQLNPNISPQCESIVLNAIAVYPRGRYQSIAEMRQAIQQKIAPVSPPALGATTPTRRRLASKRLWAAGALVMLALTAIGTMSVVIGMALLGPRQTPIGNTSTLLPTKTATSPLPSNTQVAVLVPTTQTSVYTSLPATVQTPTTIRTVSPTPMLPWTTTWAHLFTEPDTSSAVVAVLEPHTRLTPIERTRDGAWWHVRVVGEETQGWMYATLLSDVEDLGPIPTASYPLASPAPELTPPPVLTVTLAPEPNPTLQPTPIPTDIPAPVLHGEYQAEYFAISILGPIERTKAIGGEEQAEGIYLIVPIRWRNTSLVSRYIDEDLVCAIDPAYSIYLDSCRMYDVMGTSAYYRAQGQTRPWQKIAAGGSADGWLVFDIPENLAPVVLRICSENCYYSSAVVVDEVQLE
jgi:serine/threonine protein kinase